MTHLFSALVLFIATPLWAANIFVAPVQGSNLTDQEKETVGELVKAEVQNQANHTLVSSEADADETIQTKVIHFQTYTLSMARKQSGKVVNSGRWKVANAAALETQIGLAVDHILNAAPKKGAATYETERTLKDDADKKRIRSFQRIEAQKQVLIGFGPAFFSNMNTSGTGIGLQAGYNWAVDDYFDVGLHSDFVISSEHSDAHQFTAKIIGNYFFLPRDISPFIGMGFGYGWNSAHSPDSAPLADDSAHGFAGSVQAGVKLFRTSTVGVVVNGEYTHIFNDNSLGQPGSFFLKVGLLF